MSEPKAKLVKMAKGTKVELFRVFYLVGEGVRVEIQGFHTADPGEFGATLAQTADILARAMARLVPVEPGEPEVSVDAVLATMMGTMIGCLVAPIPDSPVQESFEESAFRGEPPKGGLNS